MAPVIETTSENGYHCSNKDGLKVLIVGGGIGGFAAAIALRQQGHHVHVFEQSRFAVELGAAIHLPPNVTGILLRMGIDAKTGGANLIEGVISYNSDGSLLRETDLRSANAIWQHDWLLAHRVKLHDQLKKCALDPTGEGPPVKLSLTSQVSDVDPENAIVFLKDGTSYMGDVVIGADGVHSITRGKIQPGNATPFGSGKSAFRFLISRKVAEEDPETKAFTKQTGQLVMAYGSDRRLVMYPTSHNQLLNFVCIHPEGESEATGDWSSQASKEKLLEVYKNWSNGFKALLQKADADSLKVWKLLDMKVIPSWTNCRLALLGDAAHPFLPHQGQGGAMAIEDAAALGVVLELGVERDEIPARLKLYQDIRYERAHRIQEYSRLAGGDIRDLGKFNIYEFTNYNFGHDEFDNSHQKLREWKWAQNPKAYWRMPITFGPMPGPRQDYSGLPHSAVESDFTTASIKIKTSRTLLQNLLPPGNKSYRFKSPGTVACATFATTTFDKLAWLGGSGYTWCGWYLHGVEYVGEDGSATQGSYMPILFENLTDPIVSGREELGMPKLYSEINVDRGRTSCVISISWKGSTWGTFRWEGLEEVPVPESPDPAADAGVIVHRWMPKVGKDLKGQADLSHAVWVPYAEGLQPKVEKIWKADNATIELDSKDWKALPTLHHIVERLAEIPVYEVVDAKITQGVGVPDLSAARRID